MTPDYFLIRIRSARKQKIILEKWKKYETKRFVSMRDILARFLHIIRAEKIVKSGIGQKALFRGKASVVTEGGCKQCGRMRSERNIRLILKPRIPGQHRLLSASTVDRIVIRHNAIKLERFYRFQISGNDQLKKDTFTIDGRTYHWMSIAEMEQDANIMEHNSDIVSFVKQKANV